MVFDNYFSYKPEKHLKETNQIYNQACTLFNLKRFREKLTCLKNCSNNTKLHLIRTSLLCI